MDQDLNKFCIWTSFVFGQQLVYGEFSLADAREERRREEEKQEAGAFFGVSNFTYGCGSKPMVPFWGRCTTHFGVYFTGDWDVH